MDRLPIDYRFKNRKIHPLYVVCAVLLLFAMTLIVLSRAYTKFYIVGSSMADTFTGARDKNHAGGDYVYVYRKSSPARGDIVVVSTAAEVIIIKRVIAIGGDSVELKQGTLYLNGQIKDEPYVNPDRNTPENEYNTYPLTYVPDGYIFCLGDNRNDSIDSRDEKYGLLPVTDVIGVVAEWSITLKPLTTALNTFFEFTLPSAFGAKSR